MVCYWHYVHSHNVLCMHYFGSFLPQDCLLWVILSPLHELQLVGLTLALLCVCSFCREGNSPDHQASITYSQLLTQVCRCANVLKRMGKDLALSLEWSRGAVALLSFKVFSVPISYRWGSILEQTSTSRFLNLFIVAKENMDTHKVHKGVQTFTRKRKPTLG